MAQPDGGPATTKAYLGRCMGFKCACTGYVEGGKTAWKPCARVGCHHAQQSHTKVEIK